MIETATPTMEQLQEDCGQWHRDTFGEGDFATRIARKLAEEVAELNQAIGAMGVFDDGDEGRAEAQYELVIPELADVAIGVMALCWRLGVDLDFHVGRKLDELRERTDRGEYASGRRW